MKVYLLGQYVHDCAQALLLKFHSAYSSSGPFYNTMSFMMTSLKHYFLFSAEELLSDDVFESKKRRLED